MEPTIQDLCEELQQTRKDLRLQWVWNANLEDAVTAPEVEIREQRPREEVGIGRDEP